MKLKAGKIKNNSGSYALCGSLWLFFILFVIFPLFFVLSTAKLENFIEVFASTRFLSSIKNTFLECICSTVLSVLVGYIYAYAVVRANIPFKRFFAAIPVIHMVTPPFVGGLSFILLFGRQGFITKTLFGLDVSLYGFFGLVLSQVLCFFPIAYLICSQSLQGINQSLESAAKSFGASKFKIFWTITLPLSFAGITSSLLFIAVSVLSDFGNPLIVGGRFKVLAVEIYTQLTGWLNTGTSAALGIVLLVPSIILFVFQSFLFKKNSLKLATIGGKSNVTPVLQKSTSKTADVLLTIFVSVISFFIIAQLLSIVAGSFSKLWGIDSSFTFEHIKNVFVYSPLLLNSVFFAFVASVLATLLACLIAFFAQRTNFFMAKGLNILCQIPSAIPGTLMGLSLSFAANKVRFSNSAILIILALTISYLPFSYRILSSTFSKLKLTLDDASHSLGAGKFKVLFSVIVPLSSGGIFSSFIYNFVRGVGTLSSVIFLVSFKTSLASVKILNLAEQGDWGKSASLALVLTLITFIIILVGKKITDCLESSKWKNQQV